MSNPYPEVIWETDDLPVFCPTCHWSGEVYAAAWRGDEHAQWECPECGSIWQQQPREEE